MERLIFKEEQSFKQSFVIWLLAATWLFVSITFGYGLYQQIYLGKPFGDNPTSDSALILTSMLSILLISAIVIFMLNSNLTTEIWSDGIRYKFPPLLRKTKHIPLEEISSAEVSKYSPVGEFGGWGWRRRLISRKTAYNIKGNIGLRVIKKNGSQIMFGTQRQDDMTRAISKMMKPDNEKYAF